MQETNQDHINYDTQWKAIIEAQFEDFIAFFLPQAYDLIDFAQPVEFLEQELHKIVADKIQEGKVINDKLVKVSLKNGEAKWILIHIEVQSSYESQFSKRMFTYFYRIWDRYNQDVTAIAIYTGEKVPLSFDRFEYSFLGTENMYRFNAYQVRKAREADLVASKNPFALAVLATKYLHQSKKDPLKRFAFKRKLVEFAREKGFSNEWIISLFQFINLLLLLPNDLQIEFAGSVIRSFSKLENMLVEQQSSILLEALFEELYNNSTRSIKSKAEQTQAELEHQNKVEFVHQTLLNIVALEQYSRLQEVIKQLSLPRLKNIIEAIEKLKWGNEQTVLLTNLPLEVVMMIRTALEKYAKLSK